MAVGFSGMPFIGVNFATAIMERMTIQRMEHIGIVVNDLGAAIKFFLELGLSLQGETPVEGSWVDRIVGSMVSERISQCSRPLTAMDD